MSLEKIHSFREIQAIYADVAAVAGVDVAAVPVRLSVDSEYGIWPDLDVQFRSKGLFQRNLEEYGVEQLLKIGAGYCEVPLRREAIEGLFGHEFFHVKTPISVHRMAYRLRWLGQTFGSDRYLDEIPKTDWTYAPYFWHQWQQEYAADRASIRWNRHGGLITMFDYYGKYGLLINDKRYWPLHPSDKSRIARMRRELAKITR